MKKIRIAGLKSISLIAIINILLAVLALFKDILLASYMGTSSKADAFSLAFFIPDMIGNNLIAAAMSTGCIPMFSKKYHANDKRSLNSLFIIVNISVTLISLIFVVVLYVFQNNIIDFLGHGFALSTKLMCRSLLNILIPTVIIYPIVSVGLSILQVHSRFIIASFVPVIFNLIFFLSTFICYLFRIPVEHGVYIVSISILAAEVLILTIIYCLIFRLGIRLNPVKLYYENSHSLKADIKDSYAIIKLSYGYFIILLLSQLILYYEKYLCSDFPAGSISALNYAYRISQFPIWVFVAAITMVVFPKMSKPSDESKDILTKAIGIIIVLNLPIMFAFSILNVPITSILFQRNNFDASSVHMTASIMSGYSLSILGQSICAIILRYMMSTKQIKQAVKVYIVFFISNIAFDYVLVKFMGIEGIGFGAALAWSLCAILMILSVDFDLIKILKKNYARVINLCVANILAIGICAAYRYLWFEMLYNLEFLSKIAYSLGAALICIALYISYLKKVKIF